MVPGIQVVKHINSGYKPSNCTTHTMAVGDQAGRNRIISTFLKILSYTPHQYINWNNVGQAFIPSKKQLLKERLIKTFAKFLHHDL